MSRRKSADNHVGSLQMGHYLLEIDAHGRAYTVPVSSNEARQIVTQILGRS